VALTSSMLAGTRYHWDLWPTPSPGTRLRAISAPRNGILQGILPKHFSPPMFGVKIAISSDVTGPSRHLFQSPCEGHRVGTQRGPDDGSSRQSTVARFG
jgi:hypothetical protein